MQQWNQSKFLSLPLAQQHKKASELLREIASGNILFIKEYNKISQWLDLEPLDYSSTEALSNRFHLHLKQGNVSWQEHNLLIVRKNDKISETPFLNIAIYLDNLRSAFNVGSILRTVEAFRLGSVFFSPSTPFINNLKVQKTSMGTFDKVSCYQIASLDTLPRPLIALETADFAPSISEFSFPESFTLILGNEEYGLSESVLKQVDHFVQIPLVGNKNSLNVAAAFAIAAASIRA